MTIVNEKYELAEARVDTAEEFRDMVVAFLNGLAQRSRTQGNLSRTISARRQWTVATEAYESARDFVAAVVIKPRNGGGR